MSASAEMTPSQPGTYKMSGWVDMVEKMELNFIAQATVTAKGTRFNSYGQAVDSANMDATAVESFLMSSKDYSHMTLLSRSNDTILLSMKGKMIGSYGMKTHTSFTQV